MKTALITTTVNIPKVLALYARLNSEVDIVIAADKKTPPGAEEWVYEHCQPKSRVAFLTVEMQQDMEFKSSELIGWNTDSRRNIALLYAVKSGADLIVSVDDDMIPCQGEFVQSGLFEWPYDGLQLGSRGLWFDAGLLTDPVASQRGLPVGEGRIGGYDSVVDAKIGVAQGIILGVPDTDAVTAINRRPHVYSVSDVLRNGFVVHPQAYAVFNSQITTFRRELAPAFAQFYKWEGRNTDILAALVMRRVMLERNLYTYFGPPMGFHARTPRPLFNDLKAEMYGLEHIVEFQSCLDEITLAENAPVSEWVRQIYMRLQRFSKFSWFHPELADATMAWCDDMESCL